MKMRHKTGTNDGYFSAGYADSTLIDSLIVDYTEIVDETVYCVYRTGHKEKSECVSYGQAMQYVREGSWIVFED